MGVTIYHNPRCGKSRQTLALLRERGIEPQIVEYLATPPDAAKLKELLGQLSMTPKQLMRSKEAAEFGLNKPGLTEDALVKGMVEHPIVIERPIVVNGKKAALGRPPESVLKIL